MEEQTNIEKKITEESAKTNIGWFSYVPYIIAIGVIVAYGFFVNYLLGKVETTEPVWSRLTYLISGVEAIVFAAVGFVFGREVNRTRAENAEKEKKEAKNEKKEADKEKKQAKDKAVEERKNALILGAMAIQGERTSLGPDFQTAAKGAAPKPSVIGSIADKARKMYPELNDQ